MSEKKKVGITLTDETFENLVLIAEKFGLSKSQMIAWLINNYVIDKADDLASLRKEEVLN
ncbi:CopG family transcriptional regulator [Dolosigranulum pigrum]|uniref:CopG family transcriptional regulator n=1 Tax=Dolosigranulum pigrum TaxID=29394 RepID=UPI000DC251F9|nr:CopG family transcriptional regulator [Dolosigranulum pigrum]RAN54118.1 hypothetical protein B8A31_01550 [Dolosigranulum pigrum]